MLADFDRDVSNSSSSSNWNSKTSKAGSGAEATANADSSPLSMARLMKTYEAELRHPVKNLVSGQLARCLLIQLQKVKVDSASALLEMDQVLRANELSLAATAAVPALAVVWVLGLGVKKVFFANRGPPPDPRRAAAPLRSAFCDAEDALVRAAEVGEGGGEEEEELEGKAIFEIGRALAAVDALLGLRDTPPSLFSPFRLLFPAPARAIGEVEAASNNSSSSVDALPLVGGVLASRSWRAGDAARCRSGLVGLASPLLPLPLRAEAAARLARSSALLK